MRFYREKCLLALMEGLLEWTSGIKIQKLMFLLSDTQNDRTYHFMPYKYGCYSLQLSQDLRNLVKEEFLLCREVNDHSEYRIAREDLEIRLLLKEEDGKELSKIIRRFSGFTSDELMRYTYLHYPFFAIKSVVASALLSKKELSVIEATRPTNKDRILFTIGYEGKSLEQYIVALLQHDIKVLCDVRKNAYSQKFGFSKSQLEKACEVVDISYIHLPDLGIISEKRKELKSQEDYDILFEEYETMVLNGSRNDLNKLYNLIQKYDRIALTCFEKDPGQCHRSRIANKLMSIPQCNYSLNNL